MANTAPREVARWAACTRVVKRLGPPVAMSLLVLVLLGLRMQWFQFSPATAAANGEASSERDSQTLPVEVQLTEEKATAADLREVEAAERALREFRTVPGSVTYDTARHLALTSPVDGIVSKVLVGPGQTVKKDQPLLVLSSSSVGLARDEVLKRSSERALAEKQFHWMREIAENVDELMKQLESRPKLPAVEESLAGKKLGEYRDKILSSYSKLILAELAVRSAEMNGDQGVISQRVIEERRSAREVAAAGFQSACETTRFAAWQAAETAKAEAEQCDRLYQVSQESLATLLGPLADTSPRSDGDLLSALTICAPFDGTIQERNAVASARVTAGAPLLTLADTQTMWISAEIHERDWMALDFTADAELSIKIPALVGENLTAKVRFVGSQLAEGSRSVPLVAEIDNEQGRLKPGMFAWVEVPLTNVRKNVSIPRAAVMTHEQQTFVFVPLGERRYRRVDVHLGMTSGEWVEVQSGLREGDRVVDRGAFLLKSELLLERE